MALVIPITVLAIFLILYTMFRSFKWAMLILVSVVMASIGGPLALFLTHTNFSVSSAVGFLALFGVSVETGVIMIEFINQLRARRKGMEESSKEHIIEAAVEGAVLRLRPMMMTMLVATLGLLPAALSHAIGSDSQRPFAIVIVGGLLANLVIGVFLMPALVCLDGARRRRPAGGGNQRGVLRATSHPGFHYSSRSTSRAAGPGCDSSRSSRWPSQEPRFPQAQPASQTIDMECDFKPAQQHAREHVGKDHADRARQAIPAR